MRLFFGFQVLGFFLLTVKMFFWPGGVFCCLIIYSAVFLAPKVFRTKNKCLGIDQLFFFGVFCVMLFVVFMFIVQMVSVF